MHRDVAEGNSASLKSSARFPLSQELALTDPSFFHENNLGLTLPPEFQLRENTLQNPERNPDHQPTDPAGGRDGVEQASGDGVDILPLNLDGLDAHSNDPYSSLFVSNLPNLPNLPNLDLAFCRKRSVDESQGPPEKRQHLESPIGTPSFTTGTTYESPGSFFDAFDALFSSGADIPLISPDDPLPEFEEASPQPLTPPETQQSKEQPVLTGHDNTSRPTLDNSQATKQSEYISPYPVPKEPLGYLPSAPGLQVKYIVKTVVVEDKDEQITRLRAQVNRLSRERNQYKTSLEAYTTLDEFGKPPDQILREEKARLQRVSTNHQTRAAEHKKELDYWKKECINTSMIHDNLLQQLSRTKSIPRWALVPKGWDLPKLPTSVRNQAKYVAMETYGHPPTPAPVPTPATPTTSGNMQPSAPPARPQQPAVTIDLTEDSNEMDGPAPVPSSDPKHPITIQDLQKKKYGWLNVNPHPTTTPIDDGELAPMLGGELSGASADKDAPSNTQTTDEPIDDDELARMMEEELSGGDTDPNTQPTDEPVDDDELARMMEEELSRP